MPNGVNKADLPTKTCPACQRPFTWRKKWARDWESVVYCSDACREEAVEPRRVQGRATFHASHSQPPIISKPPIGVTGPSHRGPPSASR